MLYSRTNIHGVVQEDIESSNLQELFIKAKRMIRDYIRQDYYPSKNARILELKATLDIPEIVTNIMSIVMSEQNAQPIQSAASKLGATLGYADVFDGIKTASEILAVVCQTDMFDIIAARDSETGSLMVKSRYALNDETLQFISNTKYLPPMVCKPQVLTDNTCSGYLTKNESVILGNGNHHDEYQALDVLNISQNIPYSLDQPTLDRAEESKKALDTQEKVTNFLRMVTSSRAVYKGLLDTGNKFYFTWKFDKRGRVYSQGYHVNIQSTSYKKSLINLHEKLVVTGG